MIRYDSIREITEEAKRRNRSISLLVLEEQTVCLRKPEAYLLERMRAHYGVMKEAIRSGCAREPGRCPASPGETPAKCCAMPEPEGRWAGR